MGGHSGVSANLVLLESPSSPFLAQNIFAIGPVGVNPSFLVHRSRLTEHLGRLNILCDELSGLYSQLDQYKARIEHQHRELWKANPDIRKKGLKGGSARKQRKIAGKYVPMAQNTAALQKRRRGVEKIDKYGRDRLEGIAALKLMIEEAMRFIKDGQAKGNDVLASGDLILQGLATPAEVRSAVSHVAAGVEQLMGEELLEKVDDIGKILTVIDNEFAW
ncbi:uncharacterized protein Z518_00699 [Rhinocladiella mackenziei CBS 650.93]|uniref:Rhinocladiella mackenziei CBS 650.93 unplaced genomic scaffold supercont1.1, whole genome shotgun sequence n=1 Tax=Rhinocladiella mackenziei CBS 650.93 TaxID=1442369 RepID=A0A0D2IU80_9EURO|nr:uncharacterized protein Z518_00699 [Rhinocladiella mackenziei CBS 650.93]KIX09619.1 hypothetical protein Z518_00699 [Rhinocladiella mackenziei CBS 650.93]